MQIFRAKYLLYPFILLAVLFLVDKVFLLPEVRDAFIQKGGMIWYRQRALQLDELQKALRELPEHEEMGIIMGDSRSIALGEMTSMPLIEKNPRYRKYQMFNFSGTQAVPAYHAYLAEKIFRGTKRPDFLFIGISPDAFNRNAGITGKPVMVHGLDQEFIKLHASHFPARDMQTYQNSRRFALAGMGFSVKTLRERMAGGWGSEEDATQLSMLKRMREDMRNPEGPQMNMMARMMLFKNLKDALAENMNHYSLARSPWRHILDMGRGSFYGWTGVASDEELKFETEKLKKLYFKNFIISQEQFYFLRLTLQRARLSGAQVVIFWPRVNPHLRTVYADVPEVHAVWKRVEEIAQTEGATSIDFNQQDAMDCNQFYDASHMSVVCFPEMQKILLDQL